MTTRSAAFAPQCLLLAAAVVLSLTPAAPTAAQDFALECDVVAGIRTVRLSAPKRTEVRGRILDAGIWVFEIDDPSLSGLEPGPTSCVAVRSIRVLPGYLLGTRSSRILVAHDGDTPRSFSKDGRHRLTWLPPPGAAPAPREVIAESPETSEPPRPGGDAELRRLQAQLEAERDENARLRARLGGPTEPVAEPAAEEPVAAVTPPPPSKKERKRQAKAERRAELEQRRADRRARKQAKKSGDQPPPAVDATPPAPAGPPAVPPAVPPPAEPAPRQRVVVGEPERAATTPRGLPPDYAAFPSLTTLVVTIPTDLKDGPGRRYRTLGRLGTGERVTVSGRAGDWYRVGDGEGWAFATYLESETSASAAARSSLGVVQEVTVPVHEGPGGQHAVVAELYRGQQVVIDEIKGEWAHVRNGGWVRRDALGGLRPGP